MIFGILVILLAAFANIYSFWNYLLVFREQRTNKKESDSAYIKNKLSIAHSSYNIMSILIIIASLYLLVLILDHNFQVKYIYDYTSLDLSLFYLISAFWAGQEGSFLLWTFFIAILGFIFYRSAKRFEVPSMIFLNAALFFFLLILIKASPFEILSVKPADGTGLNPLLQNPWMVIHPPVLFIGYAAITFPFVLTLGSLSINKYKECVNLIRSWTIFSSVTLGAGIIIGGYWAYGVLGWGGYWGWDPVENSSLIPWITIIILLHGLLIQQRSKKLYKTNVILAQLSFILVLYAAFLTRSGVLADFSVHSFMNLGINNYLIAFLLCSLFVSLIIYIKTYKSLDPEPQSTAGAINRQNILLLSIYVLTAMSILIFIGTSFPIITGLLGNPAQVDTSFYDRVNFPFAVFMGLFLGITPFLLWLPGNSIFENKQNVVISIILSLSLSVTGYIAGMKQLSHIVFLFSASFAFWSNILVLIKKGLKNWRSTGVHIAHTGIGLLFIGIIVSGTLSIEQNILLRKNEASKFMDYSVIYKEKTPIV